MRKAVKMASVALASLLAAGIFAGCGGDQKAASCETGAFQHGTSAFLGR